MSRWILSLALLITVVGLSACDLDYKQRLPSFIARHTETPTVTATRPPTSTPTPTATNTPTPTVTPSPTATPIPSVRLELALQIYDSGNYHTARREFEALLVDPGAEEHELAQALHWRGRSELELGETVTAIATLKSFLSQYPSHELTRSAQFNLARAYEQAGQTEEAVTAFRGSIIPEDPINVYIYQRIGDLQFQTGVYTDAISSYQAGIQATDDTSFQVHLRENIATAKLALDDPDGALAQYEAILNAAKIDNYRAKILRLAGETHLAAGDPAAAYERYLEAVNDYPEAPDSYLALVELVNAEVPVDEFQRGLVDYYAGAFQPAIAAFDRYLNSPTSPITATLPLTASSHSHITPTTTITTTSAISPSTAAGQVQNMTSRAAEAIWLIARSWQALGGYNNAIHYFQRLIDEYPTSPNWGQANLEIGITRISQDNISQAKAAFRAFAADNPDHPLAGEALWRAGLLELYGDMLEEAYANLLDLADTHPNNEYADEALYWAGQAAFIQEKHEDAAKTWARLVDSYPDSDLVNFGRYWQAKSLLALGQTDEARQILSNTGSDSLDYYSLRARDLLTGDQPHTVPLTFPTQAELAREQVEAGRWLAQWLDLDDDTNLATIGPEVRKDPAFKRGQALLQIGLRSEALVEFETVKDNWWDDPLAMYQLSVYFREHGLGRLSIRTAARLTVLSPAFEPAETPMFIQRLLYPVYFEEIILAEADKYELDPALILAIMRQESLFERSAESIAGARGLMQVMPATGEYIVERAGFETYNPDQLWLPYLSIRYGAWYIDQQLGIFDGNQFAALAAYNAGPGNVLEWIKVSDDLDVFVESIPYWESRTYIRNIYINLAAYRRIYGQ